MLKSFLIVSIRKIYKNRLSSAVSLLSLVFGAISTFAIWSYTQNERNYALVLSDNPMHIYLLEYLAALILLIAWMNFMNIQAALAPERIKEVRIRKTLGAVTSELQVLFFVEHLLMNGLAFTVASFFMYLLLPEIMPDLVADLIIYNLQITWPIAWFILAGILISSIYPACITTLQGTNSSLTRLFNSLNTRKLRNTLVTLQLAITLFLIAYTLTIYFQVQHLSSQDPINASKIL